MPTTTAHELPSGKTTTLRLTSAMCLHVHTGRLWVTRTNDLQDYFVSAGESLSLGTGVIVLEADAGMTARYTFTATASPWERALRRGTGDACTGADTSAACHHRLCAEP